jgi:hypothetical protein
MRENGDRISSSRKGQRTRRPPAALRYPASADRQSQRSPTDPGPLRILAMIGSPVALVTALMFYFGWIRTRAEAQAFGYDISVTGMSVQDFVMKSIVVLYVPLLVPLLVALLLVWLHHRMIGAARRRPSLRDSLVWSANSLTMSWTIWLAIGIILLIFVPPLRLFVIPAALTLALLSAIYGDQLRRNLNARERMPSSVRALILVALALVVFWDTERIAGAVGRAYAAQVTSNPQQLMAVTVYSPKSLDINVPGVTVTKLSGHDTAYLYRYDGLRLLQASGGNYFLISQSWDTSHRRVIVIPAASSSRVEFSR